MLRNGKGMNCCYFCRNTNVSNLSCIKEYVLRLLLLAALFPPLYFGLMATNADNIILNQKNYDFISSKT